MNQQRLSGVGNYILAEGLYKANVDPWANVKDVGKEKLLALIEDIKDTARTSLKAQGMTREKGGTFRSIDGERGKFEFKLQVYGKEKTDKGEEVLRITEGPHGRGIWFVRGQIEDERWGVVEEMVEKGKEKRRRR